MAEQPPGELIITAEEVAAGLDRLAAQLQPVVNKQGCTLIGIMTGGMYPLMQLAERLVGNFLIDYCHATRYAGATRGGEIDWLVDVFGDRAKIWPRGGHCGNMAYKENVDHMLAVFGASLPGGDR